MRGSGLASLWRLVREDKACAWKAFGGQTVFAVAYGKWAGVWSYANKQLQWLGFADTHDVQTEFYWKENNDGSSYYGLEDRKRRRSMLPLPGMVYKALGLKMESKVHLNEAKTLPKATTRKWKKIRLRPPIRTEELRPKPVEVVDMSARGPDPFPAPCLVVPPDVTEEDFEAFVTSPYWMQMVSPFLDCIEPRHLPGIILPLSYRDIYFRVDFLRRRGQLLRVMGVRKRQAFVYRVMKFGPKKALRLSFPRAPGQVINELQRPGHFGAKVLAVIPRLRRPHDLKAMDLLWEFVGRHPLGADKATAGHILWLSSRNGALDLANAWILYCRELQRAAELGFVAAWRGLDQATAREYNRRHDVLAAEIQKREAEKEAMSAAEYETRHRGAWTPVNVPANVRPLYSVTEFRTEGEEMSHCVGGYWRSGDMFAAIRSPEGDRATLQWSPTSRRIVQVHGPRNGLTPESCQVIVDQLVKELLKLPDQRSVIWTTTEAHVVGPLAEEPVDLALAAE